MDSDTIVCTRYGPTDNQKWILSDGLLSPYKDPSFFVTGKNKNTRYKVIPTRDSQVRHCGP